MPIEIRELVIKAVVTDASQQARPKGAIPETTEGRQTPSENLEHLVQQVLEVIQEHKNER